MENSTGGSAPNQETLKPTIPSSVVAAVICSGAASIIMAFLIVFGIVQSCSAANVHIFLVLLGVSAVSVLAGIIMGGLSYRKTKNRLAVLSLLLATLYVALLFFLLQLMKS
jgi:hypothetical protein